MQERYFSYLQTKYLKENARQVFTRIVKHFNVAALKKNENLKMLIELARQELSKESIFSTIAVYCIQHDNLSAIKFLIEDCNFRDLLQYHRTGSLLTEACYHGSPELILYLLNKGADVTLCDPFGNNPAHIIAQKNELAELVPILAKHNVKLNGRNKVGQTPLHLAAVYGKKKMVVALIRAGANTTDKVDGQTYKMLEISIANGEMSIEPSEPFPKDDADSDIEEINAQFFAALLLPKLNRQLFQDFIKKINSRSTINRSLITTLSHCYFLVFGDVEVIIKTLFKHLQHKNISFDNIFDMHVLLFYALTICGNYEYAKTALNAITRLLQSSNTGEHSDPKYLNQLSSCSMQVGSYSLAEEYALKGLACSRPGSDDSIRAELFCNLAMSNTFRLKVHIAHDYYRKAFALVKDDTDIFLGYIRTLLTTNQYIQALFVCLQSNCGEQTTITALHLNYLLGNISSKKLIETLISNTYSSTEAKIYAYDLLVEGYIELKDSRQALYFINLSYEASKQCHTYNKDKGHALLKALKYLLNCEMHEEALALLLKEQNEYLFNIEHNHLLKAIISMVYLNNKMPAQAHKLIKELQNSSIDKTILAKMYVAAATFRIDSDTADYDETRNYLETALSLDPENFKATFLMELLRIKIKAKEIASTQEIDSDFLKNISVEQDLLKDDVKKDVESFESDDYDPVKLHRFFQSQKKSTLASVTDSLVPHFSSKKKWQINRVVFDEDNTCVIPLDSQFYPNHYAVISSSLTIEPSILEQFKVALQKGLCRRKMAQNGIKFINGCLIELKINSDDRLYTTHIFKNPAGKLLIVFDQLGNHRTIQRILQEKKPIEICNTDPLPSAMEPNSDYPRTFFVAPGVLSPPKSDDTYPANASEQRGDAATKKTC